MLGPRSPKDPTSYEKELFFSSRPSWFLGRGFVVLAIDCFISKLITSFHNIDPTIPQCLVNIVSVFPNIDRFHRRESLYPAHQFKAFLKKEIEKY